MNFNAHFKVSNNSSCLCRETTNIHVTILDGNFICDTVAWTQLMKDTNATEDLHDYVDFC